MRPTAFLPILGGLILGTLAASPPAAAKDFQVELRMKGSPSRPVDRLISVGGELYGASGDGGPTNSGTLYVFDPVTGAVRILYGFTGGVDAAYPAGAPIKFHGKLFGTTELGGAGGQGAIYSFDLSTGAEKVVYSFKGGADGDVPLAGLVEAGGKLYGTTYEDTLFSFDPTTGVETVLYTFKGGADGASPYGALLPFGGKLFGTTDVGGTAFKGTVYSFDPASGVETVLHSFQGGSDGNYPLGRLIEVGGMLYGTTDAGGPANSGTIFSVDPATGAEAVVYAFKGGEDGLSPDLGLIEVDGELFGVTLYGGKSEVACQDTPGCGTVYSFDPATGVKKTLHYFTGGTRGFYPYSSLIKLGDRLYGATNVGGAPDCECGILYSLMK